MRDVSASAIAIVRLEEKHLTTAQILSTAVNWPHRRQDWSFALKLGRGLAAMDRDSLVGTIIWWPFGQHYARFGMLIVSPSMQRRGVGRFLIEAALRDAGGRTVLLNATVEGLPLYEKFGYKPIGVVRQHQAANTVPASAPLPEGASFKPMQKTDLDAVITLDEQAAGFRRAGLLRALKKIGKGISWSRAGRSLHGPSSGASATAM
ncbi:hypothetical protein X742_32420 [Mesorhizobium sp. LNHC232B00]|nr:hypothetical protein X742_32420 [Mesorhizobium sp. LNHC232B00]